MTTQLKTSRFDVHRGIIINKTDILRKFKSDYVIKANRFRQRNINLEPGYHNFDEEFREGKDYFTLPPKWIDIFDETKEKIKDIQEICDEVKMLAVERVKIQFGQGEIQLDFTIQKLIQTALRKIGECDESLEAITRFEDGDEIDDHIKVRRNMQKCLAMRLQEVTQNLRMQQKKILDFMNRYRPRKYTPLDFEDSNTNYSSVQGKYSELENDLIYGYEIEHLEDIAQDRNEKIDALVVSINKLNELFKQINRLVIDQGTVLDRIDYNLEKAFEKVKKGKEELQAARDIQKSPRANNCILILVILNVIFLFVIILKYTVFA